MSDSYENLALKDEKDLSFIEDQISSDDPDIIIPVEIARPLVVSSHLLLVTAIVAAIYHFWILCAVNLFVYITSVIHWSNPRFSSCERKFDYIAVLSNIIYGTIFALSLKTVEFKIIWFVGLFIIGSLFCINEVFCHLYHIKNKYFNNILLLQTIYYLQVMKSVTGEDLDQTDSYFASWATKPNSPEREKGYIRAVWMHLFSVHVLGNVLGLTMIVAKVIGY